MKNVVGRAAAVAASVVVVVVDRLGFRYCGRTMLRRLRRRPKRTCCLEGARTSPGLAEYDLAALTR